MGRGFSSWKQVRMSDNLLVKDMKRNNRMSFVRTENHNNSNDSGQPDSINEQNCFLIQSLCNLSLDTEIQLRITIRNQVKVVSKL